MEEQSESYVSSTEIKREIRTLLFVVFILGAFSVWLAVSWRNAEAALRAELAKKTPLVSKVGMSIENIRKIDFRDVQLIENGRAVRMLCTELRQGREEGSDYRFFLRDAVGPDNVPGNMWVTLPPR